VKRLHSVCLALLVAVVGCARPLPPPQRANSDTVKVLQVAFGGSAAESSGPGAAAAAEPTGWATIKGTFKLSGNPPELQPLNADKDQAICAPGGKPVPNESLVVDSASHGIKDIVIYLATPTKFPVGDPKWEHPAYASTREAMPDFDQKNCVFLSHMMGMRSSQKLRVLNSDPVGHNTNISGGGRAKPDNISVAANSYTTYVPGGESPEPFSVICNIHNWMSARLIVRDSPYFAVTKPDGSFEIANVPAGVPLEFRVWQERAKFLQKVNVNGKDETWSKGRLKLTLANDEQKALDVVVDASAFK
jgi:hypothetical protein